MPFSYLHISIWVRAAFYRPLAPVTSRFDRTDSNGRAEQDFRYDRLARYLLCSSLMRDCY